MPASKRRLTTLSSTPSTQQQPPPHHLTTLITDYLDATATLKDAKSTHAALATRLKRSILNDVIEARDLSLQFPGIKVKLRRRKVGKSAPLDRFLLAMNDVPVVVTGGGTRIVLDPDVVKDEEMVAEINRRLEGLCNLFIEEEVKEVVKLGEGALEKGMESGERADVLPHIVTISVEAVR